MAICDFKYKFVCVDVGAKGRQSDGGVFSNSSMGRLFANDRMDLPSPAEISPGGPCLPFTLLGDEAFGLKPWLTTPYPGKGTGKLELYKEVFNYRQSRARRVIENAFGILVSRWRILKTALEVTLDNVDNIVKATVCLHNFLLLEQESQKQKFVYVTPNLVDQYVNGVTIDGNWRNDGSQLDKLKPIKNKNPSFIARGNRDVMAEFFMTDGEVPWQYNAIA